MDTNVREELATQTLVGKANEVLSDRQTRKLSDRDRDIFLAMLDEDMEPNEAFNSAFEARDRLIAK
jgi:uncharacterized protein (DUF1778 family)